MAERISTWGFKNTGTTATTTCVTPGQLANAASSTITYNYPYQPGGVATMVGGNLVGRLKRPREDSTASDVGQHALSAVKTTAN
jgi:hypothetical protein